MEHDPTTATAHLQAGIQLSETSMAGGCSHRRYAYNNQVFKELAIKPQAADKLISYVGEIALHMDSFLSCP